MDKRRPDYGKGFFKSERRLTQVTERCPFYSMLRRGRYSSPKPYPVTVLGLRASDIKILTDVITTSLYQSDRLRKTLKSDLRMHRKRVRTHIYI